MFFFSWQPFYTRKGHPVGIYDGEIQSPGIRTALYFCIARALRIRTFPAFHETFSESSLSSKPDLKRRGEREKGRNQRSKVKCMTIPNSDSQY